MPRAKCPKGREPHTAYRVWAETTSPKTHRSTKVALPAVFCGTLGTKEVPANGGKVRYVGTYKVEEGQHGFVDLDPSAFAVARRQSVAATTKAHPAWAGKHVQPPTPKERKAAAKPAPRAKRKASPPPKTRPRGRTVASRAPPAEPAHAEPTLTEAGKALAASIERRA